MRVVYAVYSIDVAEVALSWKTLCETESDRICTSVQIRELIDQHGQNIISHADCCEMIEHLCLY